MSAIQFWNTYLSIIFVALVFMASGQQAHGQTPEPTATPRITPGDFVDALNGAFGKQTTNRATHAKGIVLLGKFTPASDAAALSKAPHFKQAVPITVRFSDNTGIPTLPDAAPQARPHGMAIKFHLPDGTDTDLVTHSLNGFPAKTAEDMRQFILAGRQFLSKDAVANVSHDYLIDEIRARVGKGPVRFKLVLQLPAPGDQLEDPSIPWADTNKTMELGTIEITSVVPDSDATQRALLFLRSLLPDGIEPADPMIRFRGLAYPVSYDRRHP